MKGLLCSAGAPSPPNPGWSGAAPSRSGSAAPSPAACAAPLPGPGSSSDSPAATAAQMPQLFISEDEPEQAKMAHIMPSQMQHPMHHQHPQQNSPGFINRRGQKLQHQWQDFIEKEQNTVENLIADSFAALCQELRDTNGNKNQQQGYNRLRADSLSSGMSSVSRGRQSSECSSTRGRQSSECSSTATGITDLYSGSMTMKSTGSPAKSGSQSSTLPRNISKKVIFSPQQVPDSCTNCGHCQPSSVPSHPSQEGFQLSSPPSAMGGVTWNPRTPLTTLPSTNELSHQHQAHNRRLSASSHHISTVMAEVERLYEPMKNLNSPLPNSSSVMGSRMPALFPIHHNSMEEVDQSDVMSCIDIPPPPPPVQSHAVLEEGLGHELPTAPRTPGKLRRFDWNRPPPLPTPPLPPKRVSSSSSRGMLRPTNLNLSNESSSSIYSRPKPYIHRSSLMSTGSSDSGASSVPSEPELPMSPLTPSAESVFSWPNFAITTSSPSPSDSEHRSVSQIGERGGDSDNGSVAGVSVNTSMTSHSGVYCRMHPVFSPENPDSPYMNLLYSAVQRQGGVGNVETAMTSAMSPYLSMQGSSNIRNMRNASIDTVSAIYAQIDSVSSCEDVRERGGKTGGGVKTSSDGEKQKRRSSSSRSKHLAEFKELMIEVEKKRHFRVGLNLFNSVPEMGIDYLVKQNYLELSPGSVAKFVYKNPGLSKAKVGEYLGNLQSAFSMKVLNCFMQEFNFSGMRIDKSLRKVMEFMRVPGEAQKIEKIMDEFGKRYNKCNPSFASKLKSPDSVVTLAYAVMLLNTDLHTPNLKADKKMLEKEFMNNIRGADDGNDFDSKLLKSIYKGIKKQAFSVGVDHVTQTQLLQAGMTGKDVPRLAEHHRRLVCLCRLSEVIDINSKKESDSGIHARDIWLFNDMLVTTKQAGKSPGKGGHALYSYRDCFSLKSLEVTLFHTPVYKYGIQISRKGDGNVLATLNAGSEQDRYKFVMDLQESIFEMDLMDRALKQANLK